MKYPILVVAVLVAAGHGGEFRKIVDGSLRFHHLHLRVDDPAMALNDLARRTGGSRVLLQGLGVGIRIGDQYVLFDRPSEAVAPGITPHDPAAQYASAVRWLRARNIAVMPQDFGETRVAAALSDAGPRYGTHDRYGIPDHVAFAADDLESQVSALERAGAMPVRRTGESVFFAAGQGGLIEITRDNERPAAFWCPMHPEVRSSAPERCPICSMELVRIPSPTFGHYRLDVTQVPRRGKGVRALRLAIHRPDSTEPVTAFAEIHERLLHLFVIRRDLSYFAHLHPERSGARFEVPVDLEPGSYVLIADFVPEAGTPQLVQHAIVTPGYAGSPFAKTIDLKVDLADKIVDGVRISLSADAKAEKASVLRFTMRDASTGVPLRDLEPYLGASGHLLVVNADLTQAIHAHPEGVATSGPEVVFEPLLPDPAVYKLWVQFQRGGKVFTAPFAIGVQ